MVIAGTADRLKAERDSHDEVVGVDMHLEQASLRRQTISLHAMMGPNLHVELLLRDLPPSVGPIGLYLYDVVTGLRIDYLSHRSRTSTLEAVAWKVTRRTGGSETHETQDRYQAHPAPERLARSKAASSYPIGVSTLIPRVSLVEEPHYLRIALRATLAYSQGNSVL